MECTKILDDDIVVKSSEFIIQKLEEIASSTDKDIIMGLSGGNSPRALYTVLADRLPSKLIERLIFIQIDERMVDITHEDSNQNLITSTLQGAISKGSRFLSYACST